MASILRATRASGEIIPLEVDFSTFAATSQFAKKVQTLAPQLHVVLLNVGVGMSDFRKGSEGHEICLQVNVLSTTLLALLLLPQLCAAAAAADDDSFAPHLTFTSKSRKPCLPTRPEKLSGFSMELRGGLGRLVEVLS